MDDLIVAVIMTAAVPGLVLGLIAAIRSGFSMMLLGALVGLIGGLAGGFGLPAFVNAFGPDLPQGPALVVAGSLLGAFLALLLTSGLRTTSDA